MKSLLILTTSLLLCSCSMWIESADSNKSLTKQKPNSDLNKEFQQNKHLHYNAYSIPLTASRYISTEVIDGKYHYSKSETYLLGLLANKVTGATYQMNGTFNSHSSLNKYGLILFAKRESSVLFEDQLHKHYEAAYTPAFYTRTSHSINEGKIRELSILKGLLGWRRHNRRHHLMFMWWPIPLQSSHALIPGLYSDGQNTLTLSKNGRFTFKAKNQAHSEGSYIIIDDHTLSLRNQEDDSTLKVIRKNDSLSLKNVTLSFTD
ncbi:MAG: hypothetical protein HRT88_05155 [Lentisphaeraceae bacterium]|nr:hypothetical protein [Lentisphaeraceae bacterium]